MAFIDRLMPVKDNSGFKMDGWFVWCGSVMYENGIYYLFAARWPEDTGFPQGYMTHSEIVLATTDSLDKPFVFQKTVIKGRGDGFWDGQMAHNPFIVKADGRYVLFYIGTPDGSAEKRAIGYAVSDRIDGPYTPSDQPLPLPANANNPSVLFGADGSVRLYFRDGHLRVSVATAPTIDGPYTVLNDNCFPKGTVEDMFVYRENGGYVMIAEDDGGAYTGLKKGGVLFRSEDGIHWGESEQAFTFHVETESGETLELQRRERPMLLFGETCDYLFTTAKINGPDKLTGGRTWNMVEPVRHD